MTRGRRGTTRAVGAPPRGLASGRAGRRERRSSPALLGRRRLRGALRTRPTGPAAAASTTRPASNTPQRGFPGNGPEIHSSPQLLPRHARRTVLGPFHVMPYGTVGTKPAGRPIVAVLLVLLEMPFRTSN